MVKIKKRFPLMHLIESGHGIGGTSVFDDWLTVRTKSLQPK